MAARARRVWMDGDATRRHGRGPMAHWLVVVSRERHLAERLYHHEALELSAEHGEQLAEGDDVVVAAGAPPQVFGLGRVAGQPHGEDYDPDDPDAPDDGAEVVSIRYTHRLLDAPVPVDFATKAAGWPLPLDEETFGKLAARIGPEHAVTAPRKSWLVGVELPIEATSPAEAVRQFWSYVMQLGPRELPAFVSPAGDELAMQAYVLGEEANLDPEEEDE